MATDHERQEEPQAASEEVTHVPAPTPRTALAAAIGNQAFAALVARREAPVTGPGAGNAVFAAQIAGPKLQRQNHPSEGELPAQAKQDMDDYVTQVKYAINPYRMWKADPERSGADVPGPKDVETASKNAKIGQYALPEVMVAARAYARTQLGEEAINLIREAGSIADYPFGATEELLGIQRKPAEHNYVMTLSTGKEGGVLDKGMAILGTRVSITYSNALGADFSFKRDYVITGIALSAGLSFVATPRRMIQDWFLDGPGPGTSGKSWGKDWMETMTDPVKAMTHESGKPWDLGLDLDLLSLQIGAEGIKSDKPGQYWSPNDITGAVLVPRLGRATGSIGPIQIQGVVMDAVVFLGRNQMKTELSFPNLNPTVTPPSQIVQGAGGTTAGLIIDLKLVELGGGAAKLV